MKTEYNFRSHTYKNKCFLIYVNDVFPERQHFVVGKPETKGSRFQYDDLLAV